MNDCLVTKLKGTVNNDSLEYLGMIEMELFPTMGVTKVVFDAPQTVRILHGTVGGQTEVSFAANEDVYIVNKGTIVVESGYEHATILIPKYHLKQINVTGANTGQTLTYLSYIDLTKFKYSPLQQINITTCSIVPDMDVLLNIPVITLSGLPKFTKEFDISNLGSTGKNSYVSLQINVPNPGFNLVGSLDKVGYSKPSVLMIPGTQAISLNIERFVAYNRGAGKTTGSLSLPWVGACKCTFNGNNVANKETNTLSWTASTITFNGTEINNSTVLIP